MVATYLRCDKCNKIFCDSGEYYPCFACDNVYCKKCGREILTALNHSIKDKMYECNFCTPKRWLREVTNTQLLEFIVKKYNLDVISLKQELVDKQIYEPSSDEEMSDLMSALDVT